MHYYLLIIPLILAIASIALNVARSKREIRFSLTPNCLLTKHSISFVNGKKSLFFFKNYWNNIPLYLYEHGYVISPLSLPWRNQIKRKDHFLKYLNQLSAKNKKTHIFIDESQKEELTWLTKSLHSAVASITIICSKQPTNIQAKHIHNLPIITPTNDNNYVNFSLLHILNIILLKAHNYSLSFFGNNLFCPINAVFAIPNKHTELPFLKEILHHSTKLAEFDFTQSLQKKID